MVNVHSGSDCILYRALELHVEQTQKKIEKCELAIFIQQTVNVRDNGRNLHETEWKGARNKKWRTITKVSLFEKTI